MKERPWIRHSSLNAYKKSETWIMEYYIALPDIGRATYCFVLKMSHPMKVNKYISKKLK